MSTSTLLQRPPGTQDGVLLAAMGAAVADVIGGPRQSATVLGMVRLAIIVGTDTGRVVSILAPKASLVPNGVRLTGPMWRRAMATQMTVESAGVRVAAMVGEDQLQVGHLLIRPVRTWPTSVPRVSPCAGKLAWLADRLVAMPKGVAAQRVAAFSAALRSNGELAAAVTDLVGCGDGLTPAGDDVLAGFLVGARAVGADDVAERVWKAVQVRPLATRTTALSAELLRLAHQGHACREVLRLLRSLSQPDADSGPALAAVQAVGHTSGADLATGLLLALTQVTGLDAPNVRSSP